MIKIAVCDDSAKDAAVVQQYLSRYQTLHPNYEIYVELFQNGEELLQAHEQHKIFDLYFMDIIMPGISGIEIARRLRADYVTGLIVFLTTSTEFPMEAFEVKALQYLLKPLKEEQFFVVMDDAADLLNKIMGKYFLVSTSNGKITVRYSSITHIECKSRTLYIHLNSGEILISKTIRRSFEKEMQEILKDSRFCRPHQSYVINMDYASHFLLTEIVMQDSSIIPISKQRMKDIRKEYFDYLSQQTPEI